MINEFKYGQNWKIWPSPLNLSLYSTFKYDRDFLINRDLTWEIARKCSHQQSNKLSSQWTAL